MSGHSADGGGGGVRGLRPTLLAEHAARELGVDASADTVRRWLTEAGLWTGKRKRARRRSRRPRRAALGELVQWDSSVHAWLEDRGPGDLVLVALHDDATGRMLHGRGEPAGDHRVHRAPRSAVGRVHGPRRTLRLAGERTASARSR